MSLINKMLRDLDQRNAPAMDRSGMPSHVHPLPPERSGFPLWIVPALAVAAAAAWFFLDGQEVERAKVSPPPRAAATTSVRVPQPAAQLQPEATAAAPAVAPVVAAPEPPVPELVVPKPVVPDKADNPPIVAGPVVAAAPARQKKMAVASLRLETNLPGVKEKAAAETIAAPVPAPARPGPTVKDAQPSSDPASIDKRPRTSMANDGAENEYRKAMSALRRGATNEAVPGLHAALRLDPRHVSARQALLSLMVEQQQWGEAQTVMEEGLALDPAQTGWAMALARLQLENGKLAEAAETLARHTRYAEQNADYQAFQALLLQKQKRSREAAERYRVALALKPTASNWWYGLGLVLEADQKPQEARDAFLKARETGNLPPELASAVEQRLR